MRLTRRDLTKAAIAAGVAVPTWTLARWTGPRQTWAQAADGEPVKTFAEYGDPLYPPDFTAFNYVNVGAPKGGTLQIGAQGTFERLDTIRNGGDWAAGIGLTGVSLMAGSGDELASYYPFAAEYLTLPPDLSNVVFKLREGMVWDDGTPITADDFVFAFDHIKQNARPLLKEFWRDIKTATALSPLEVKFDFATTGNRKVVGMACGFGPMPKRFWETSGRDIGQSYLDPVPSEGPYRIVDVAQGRSITYERVKDWWGADLPVTRGTNNFDRITYQYYRDDDVMFEAFLSGNFDLWGENRARRWATEYDDNPNVQAGRIVRLELPNNSPMGFIGFVFNTRRPSLSDARVRQALGYLFDFEWTQKTIFYGQYARAKSYFPNSDYGTRDFPLPEGTELTVLEPFRDKLPPELFTEPFTVPSTDGSGQIRSQLRECWRLMAQAGWQVGEDTVLRHAASGEAMELELLAASETLMPLFEPFRDNMKRAGITMTIRVVDPSQYERRTQDFDYDMIYIGANFFPPPGPEMATYFKSDAADEVGSANWAGVRDPVVDALLEQIALPTDDLELKKAQTRALDRVLLRSHYIIPSYYPDKDRIAYWSKLIHPETFPFYGSGFPDTWWSQPT